MGNEEGRGASSLRPFAIGYLVWHCLNMLVTLCLLGYVTLSLSRVEDWATLRFPVLGITVSAVALVILGWVLTALVTVLGVAFALGSIGVWKIRAKSVRRFGLCMLALCIAELVLGIIQANFFTLLCKAISILLTGAILHELKSAADEDGGVAHSSQTKSTAEADEANGKRMSSPSAPPSVREATSSAEDDLPAPTRHLVRMCEGYALIMFFWGALRLLTGLAEISNGGFSAADEASVRRVVEGVTLAVVGIYLIAVGRYGKLACIDRSRLKVFRTLSVVGLCLSVASVIPEFVWAAGNAEVSVGDLFCSAIDLALYGAGVHYARKLSMAGEGKQPFDA